MDSALSIIKDTFFKKVGVWILYPTLIMTISFFMKNYLSPQFEELFYFSNLEGILFFKFLYLFSIFNAITAVFALTFWTKYFLFAKHLTKNLDEDLDEDQMNSLLDLFIISQNLYFVVITLSISLYNLTNSTSILALAFHSNWFQCSVLAINVLLVGFRIIQTIKNHLF